MKVYCLARIGLVGNNASVIQVTNHGQIENAFFGLNISNRLAVSLKLRFSFLIVSITLILNSPLYILFGIPFGI